MSPDRGSVFSRFKRVWRTKRPTGNLLGGVAGDGSLQILDSTNDAIRRTLGIALSLSLLALDIALGLTLLARRLQRLRARHVANRLLHRSDDVLDVAGHLAVDEPSVSVGDGSAVRGGWGIATTNLGSEDIVEIEYAYRDMMQLEGVVEEFGEDARVDRLGIYTAQDEEGKWRDHG